MATIHIDNEARSVDDGVNMLEACLTLGYDLPYFCWHPALGSVGACRQCAIKEFRDEKDTRGKIVMACMTPVKDGARIAIADPEAQAFRKSIIEWLMVNHPHDCPVCDEGGECHLQDMTVLTGHARRRYTGAKRTFRNQDLGPFVSHEMNRCIQCYRCVRYYRDHAGGRDFDAHGIRNQVYFGRHADGVLESEFAGNLVEVCPTGVFTDKTLARHYTRKWDLQNAPSLCVHCGLGCNIIAGERQGALRRIHTRYNGAVNGYFLCDRGRYGYEFVNAATRIRAPRARPAPGAGQEAVTEEQALARAAAALRSGKTIGIGSPRASLEANFALRALVGADGFFLGMAERERELIELIVAILASSPARTPSLREMERADAVLLLGEDVTNTAPMMALALRQTRRRAREEIAARLKIPHWDAAAVAQAGGEARVPFFIAATGATRLDDVALAARRAAPSDIARLGAAVAAAVSGSPPIAGLDEDTQRLAADIAQALGGAKHPLVVSGTGCASAEVIRAAAAVAASLCAAGRECALAYALPECNSMGLALMGGRPLAQAFASGADTVIVLENDLYRRAETARVDAFFAAARETLVIEHTENPTSARAGIVFPAATYAEADGTLVNSEGRAQRFFQVFVPDADGSVGIRESWRWLRDVMHAADRDRDAPWRNLDEVIAACCEALPGLAAIAAAAPGAGLRLAGQKIAREPHRYSGRTAMRANVDVHEARTPADPDSALSFSMEGHPAAPPALIPYFWAPNWNSIQAVYKFQERVGGALRGGDPGVRLIEPDEAAGARAAAEHAPPEAFKPRQGEWLIVPLHHIFGSEELSILAPGIRELAPSPYVALGGEDAQRLEARAGDVLEVRLAGGTRELPLRIAPLPAGVAGLPAGLPQLAGTELPVFAAIAKAARSAAPATP